MPSESEQSNTKIHADSYPPQADKSALSNDKRKGVGNSNPLQERSGVMSKKINILSIIICVIVFSGLYEANICYSETTDVNDANSTVFDLRYAADRLLVQFAPKSDGQHRTTAERDEILLSADAGTVTRSYKIVPGLSLVKLPTGLTVEDALKKLMGADGILYAEPDYVKSGSTYPNDPRFNELWNMHNIGQVYGKLDADIDAPEAWDIRTDSDIIVAVIDSGIDYTHPDLAANMWINPGEDFPPLGVVGPEDFNGVNDDGNYDSAGNPLIDDIYGYDFCTYGGHVRDSDPMDDEGHGTHVAGIIGAVGNNNTGITGVCWKVKIMALKISKNSLVLLFNRK